MKKNMKGFTLIELLAVIVILGIIMVVAVPQILNVIADSRRSAWDSNIKLIKESIELKTSIDLMGDTSNWVATKCSTINTAIKEVSDVSTCTTPTGPNANAGDVNVTCSGSGPYVIEIKACDKGKFKGQATAKLTCTAAGSCTQTQ